MAARIMDFPSRREANPVPPDRYLVTPVHHGIPRDDLAQLITPRELDDQLTDDPIPFAITDKGWAYAEALDIGDMAAVEAIERGDWPPGA